MRQDARPSQRDPAGYPVIWGEAPFGEEEIVANLPMNGCPIVGHRTVLLGSLVKLSVILPGLGPSRFIELGQVRWVGNNVFGVEFRRMSALTHDQLAHVVGHQPIPWSAHHLSTNSRSSETSIAMDGHSS